MKTIVVKTQFEALHKWKDAPDEVSFLRNPHRHIFIVRAEFEVSHNDRELEFFIVKNKLDEFIEYSINKNNAGSCEAIAEFIFYNFSIRPISVSVFEDDENGAIVK